LRTGAGGRCHDCDNDHGEAAEGHGGELSLWLRSGLTGPEDEAHPITTIMRSVPVLTRFPQSCTTGLPPRLSVSKEEAKSPFLSGPGLSYVSGTVSTGGGPPGSDSIGGGAPGSIGGGTPGSAAETGGGAMLGSACEAGGGGSAGSMPAAAAPKRRHRPAGLAGLARDAAQSFQGSGPPSRSVARLAPAERGDAVALPPPAASPTGGSTRRELTLGQAPPCALGASSLRDDVENRD